MDTAPHPATHGSSSSDPIPTAAGKRSRACERCWRRKQKCDRLFPACTPCAALGLGCLTRNSGLLVHTPDGGSALTADSLPNYVEALKRRIGEQEEQLAQRKRGRVSSSSAGEVPTTQDSAVDPQSPQNVEDTTGGSVRATLGQIGFLSRNAMAEPRDGEGTRELFCHLATEKLVAAAVALDTASSRLSQVSTLTSSARSVDLLALRRESTISFVRRFLDGAPTLLLVHLDKSQLMQQYEAVIADHTAGNTASSGSQSHLRGFDVYMAIAIGALLSPDSARLESFSTTLHAAAVKPIPALLRTGGPLVFVHCVLFLVVFSTLSAHGGSTWPLLGLCMSKCITFGLHKSPDPNLGLSRPEVDYRSRLFWSLYLIDRSLSTVMDRPFAIQDHDLSAQIPDEEADSLTYHLIMQAKLISHIRSNDADPPVHNYRNFLYWRQLPAAVRHLAATSRNISNLLHRLQFRTLAQLVQSLSYHEPSRIVEGVKGLEADAVAYCRIFTDDLHNHMDHVDFSGSSIDAYDMLAAGVLIIYLETVKLPGVIPPQVLLEITKTVQKCCTLLAVIGERLPQFRSFRKVLSALSDHIVEEPSHQRKKTSNQSTILKELPGTVPDRIKRMIDAIISRR